MPLQYLKLMALGVALIMAFCSGYRWRDLGAKADALTVETAHVKEVAEYESRAREASDKAAAELARKQDEIAEIDKRHTEEMTNAKIETDKRLACIADGTCGLSIPARSPAPNCLRADGSAASASVGNGKARTDIDPQTSQRIVAITDDGDKAIRQLAACQDYVKAINVRIK